ncbi:MAG: hypothetical protein J6B28_03325 [Eubacterium sp.]|nr:hypothetical protein [Eubacterium sp.]
MKLKYYLRGIGIGVIITTVVLTIAFSIQKNKQITDEEIRERAAALGMVMPNEIPERDTLANAEANKEAAQEKEFVQEEMTVTDESEPADKEPVSKADSATKTEKTTSEKTVTEKTKKSKADKTVVEQVELSIVGGEYSDIICEKLRKAGLIEDAEDFNKYLAQGGYDNQLQPGTYVIPKGADYDTIIKIITTKQEEEKKNKNN